ncbi:hypothetical protein SNE40_002844 [Patella caerulea]|uniref:DH domain-containing protein n=1 Tax=Patella caerulea TaxID=87958 RepID=A0AAN8KD28_PATCE
MMGIDYGHLFGNMEEIADVSQCFLNSLETAVLGKRFDEQIVGTSFVKYAEDMKNTYAPYCRNHDEVITTLEKYNAVPVIKEYFQRIITKMKEKCNVFDLDALLIKPIQRILKYPLLLGELLRVC